MLIAQALKSVPTSFCWLSDALSQREASGTGLSETPTCGHQGAAVGV